LIGKGPCATSPIRVQGIDHLVLCFLPEARDGMTLQVNPIGLPPRSPMIEMTGGHLELIGARMQTAPLAPVSHLIHVKDGSLTLTRCRLDGLSAKSSDAFKAVVSVSSQTDSPATVLLRDNVLLSSRSVLELRGNVQLRARNNVLVSLADAMQIEASDESMPLTHVLDHNTLGARHGLLLLRGPSARPGGVTLHAESNAFLRPFADEPDRAVLLRAEEGWISGGGLSWRGRYNVYDPRWHQYLGAIEKSAASKQTLRDWRQTWGRPAEQDALALELTPATRAMLVEGIASLGRLTLPPSMRGDPGQRPPGADLPGLGIAVKKK